MRRTALTAMLIASLAAVSGCSGGDARVPAAQSVPSVTPSSDHPTEATATWEELATIEVPFHEVNHLQIDGDTLVFAHAGRGEKGLESLDNVGALNWRTGLYRKIYTTQFPHGKIDWPAVEGGWVVFADADRVGQFGDEGSTWRLLAKKANGKGPLRELAHSPEGLTSWEPLVESTGGHFSWEEVEDPRDPAKGLRIRTWSPDGKVPTDVMRHAKVTGTLVTDRGAIFTKITRQFSNGDVGFDLFLREAGTGRERRITDRGLVAGFDVDGDVLAWEERREPSQEDGAPGPLNAVWLAQLNKPRQQQRVANNAHQGNVTAGSAGIAAWWQGHSRVVVAWPGLDHPVQLSSRPSSVPARIAVHKDLVAWATSTQDGQQIHVARVTPTAH